MEQASVWLKNWFLNKRTNPSTLPVNLTVEVSDNERGLFQAYDMNAKKEDKRGFPLVDADYSLFVRRWRPDESLSDVPELKSEIQSVINACADEINSDGSDKNIEEKKYGIRSTRFELLRGKLEEKIKDLISQAT